MIHIINKIIDLIPLIEDDIFYINTLSPEDKMKIIKIYYETINNIIYFIENFL
jgi:hypothetical protein